MGWDLSASGPRGRHEHHDAAYEHADEYSEIDKYSDADEYGHAHEHTDTDSDAITNTER